MKKVLINVEERELRVAILEDEQLVEFYIDALDEKSILNNIYKGRIEGILPGLKAAFVNIGLERNAFLHFDDVRTDLLWAKYKELNDDSEIPQPPSYAAATPEEGRPEQGGVERGNVERGGVERVRVVHAAPERRATSEEGDAEHAAAPTEEGDRQGGRRRNRRGGKHHRRQADQPYDPVRDEVLDAELDSGDDEEESSAARVASADAPPPQRPEETAQEGAERLSRSERHRRRKERWEQKKRERQQLRQQQPRPEQRRPQQQQQQQRQIQPHPTTLAAAAAWVPPGVRGAAGTRAGANPYDVFSPYSQPQQMSKRQARRMTQTDSWGSQGPAAKQNDHRESQEDFFGPAPRHAGPEHPVDDDRQPFAPQSQGGGYHDEPDYGDGPMPGNEKFAPSQPTRGSQFRDRGGRRDQRGPGGGGGRQQRPFRSGSGGGGGGGRNRSMRRRDPNARFASKVRKTKDVVAAAPAAEPVKKRAVATRKTVAAAAAAPKPKRVSVAAAGKKAVKAVAVEAPKVVRKRKTVVPEATVVAKEKTVRVARKPKTVAAEKTPETAPAISVTERVRTASREKTAETVSAATPPVPSAPGRSADAAETEGGRRHTRRGRRRPGAGEQRREPVGTAPAEKAPESQRDQRNQQPQRQEHRRPDRDQVSQQPGSAQGAAAAAAEESKKRRTRGRRGGKNRTDKNRQIPQGAVPQAQPAHDQPRATAEIVDVPIAPAPVKPAEIVTPAEAPRVTEPRRKWNRPPQFVDLFKKGDEVTVQVIKEEIGMKGARISTFISLPGRYLVLLPYPNEEGGISRKVEDVNERKRLKRILRDISSDNSAFIIRTAGVYREEKDILSDVEFLSHEWATIADRSQEAEVTSLVYDDHNILYRLARDVFDDNISEILIDSHVESEKLRQILSKLIPPLVDKVKVYSGPENIFQKYGVEKQIQKAARRKVWLKSGGYLIIDEAEALTAIDVNTGKSVGKDDQEKLILKTNLEACRAVARELKLRDIGGLIVIDFIDMKDNRNREQVLTELKSHLRRDRSKTSVSTMSEFGLVEMTRKRVRRSLRKTLFMDCPYCQGAGVVLNEQQIWLHIKHELVRMMDATRPAPSLSVTVNPRIRAYIDQNYKDVIRRLEQRYDTEVRFIMSDAYHVENYAIGKIGDTTPPVTQGPGMSMIPSAAPGSPETAPETAPVTASGEQ